MHSEGAMKIGSCIIHYSVKYYDGSSVYGIDEGRISKLTLKQGSKFLANYDRGWDMKPETYEAKAALAILMKEYN